ncbi:GntR family transcriptional regulator [Cribrihabitans pelagius]|uniref:GntR family transcriptional regulator n=1 Tax=Cribrihabitans pelagius TaxID=1765746 RepID=UPI003B5C0F67
MGLLTLTRLASDRVIELVANRGVFVAQPSAEEAREVFRARRVIEGHLIRRAAERRNPPMGHALTEHLHAEQTAREMGGTAQVIRRCSRYHQLLADHADSLIMAGFVRELIARSSLIVAIYEKSKPDNCEIDEHRLLSDYVLGGHADEAAALMERHLQGIEDRLDLNRKSGTMSALSQSLGFT